MVNLNPAMIRAGDILAAQHIVQEVCVDQSNPELWVIKDVSGYTIPQHQILKHVPTVLAGDKVQDAKTGGGGTEAQFKVLSVHGNFYVLEDEPDKNGDQQAPVVVHKGDVIAIR